jgi:hypothetical protein
MLLSRSFLLEIFYNSILRIFSSTNSLKITSNKRKT